MVWTLTLVPVSILGVWLAAKHWYGWAVSQARRNAIGLAELAPALVDDSSRRAA